MHVTLKTGIPVSQLPVCSAVSSQPQQYSWTHLHRLNSFFHASSYFLMLLLLFQPQPFSPQKCVFFNNTRIPGKVWCISFPLESAFLTRKMAELSDLHSSCHQCPISVSDNLPLVTASFSINTEKNVSSNTRFLQTRLPLARLGFTLRQTSIKASSKIKLWRNRAASASYLFHSSIRKIFRITPRKQALKIVLKRQMFFWLPHPRPAPLHKRG